MTGQFLLTPGLILDQGVPQERREVLLPYRVLISTALTAVPYRTGLRALGAIHCADQGLEKGIRHFLNTHARRILSHILLILLQLQLLLLHPPPRLLLLPPPSLLLPMPFLFVLAV